MKNNGLGDWRIQAATRLAKDVPAAYPGGPSHKAGSPVYLTTVSRDARGHCVGFITPSPTALALSLAASAGKRAVDLRATLALKDVVTPYGSGMSVAQENLPHLFNYFEQCMVAVSFSFQALETFCNDIIANKLEGTFQLRRRRRAEEVSSDELQRIAATEEKLAIVLPAILGLKSPKGRKVWQHFTELKRVRDATIHLKSYEALNRDIDEESLFYQFFRLEADRFPRVALDMIEYFIIPGQVPRWFELARDQFSRD